MGTYDSAINAFREGKVFTAFDLETTGLDPVKDKIAEIGAVKFDKKGIIARFCTLVDPLIPIPAEAGEINKITDEMLKGKPVIEEAIADFLAFAGNSILMAHNAPFDCGFINQALADLYSRNLAEFSSLPNTILDTRILFKEFFPDLESYALGKLAAAMNINTVNTHRAEDDALICRELFLICLDKA